MTIKAIRPDAASGAGLDRGDARPIGRNARIPLGGVQIVAGIVLIGMVALGLTGYVEKWLWMRQLDFVAIFWTLLSVQCAMGLAAFVFAFAFLWLNLRRSVRSVAAAGSAAEPASGPGLGRRGATRRGDRGVSQDIADRLRLCQLRRRRAVRHRDVFAMGHVSCASATARPSAYPIRSTASTSASMSFISPSMKCCSEACWCSRW